MENFEYSKDDEIKNVESVRPHVVLLGAGASKASFPDGDKNGIKVPVMNELFELIDLEESLINQANGNFEEMFSSLYQKDPNSELVKMIENKIYDFFANLELPDYPTIYDYIVLSLRPKDIVATFNWDPFLWLAAQRNYGVAPLPNLIFLHGNVAVGYCHNCKIKGYVHSSCSKCGQQLSPSKLLYPVKQKDYILDPGINSEWNAMRKYIQNAFMFTVFGYSAPETDAAAVNLLKESWGDKYKRNLEELEFIHKEGKTEEDVIKPWRDFIHTHHYRSLPCDNFFNSWIAKHPRRSCEVLWQEIMEAKFVSENPVPMGVTLAELKNWYRQLVSYEF